MSNLINKKKKSLQKVVSLTVAGSRDLGSFKQSVVESKWQGSGIDILMTILYFRSKRFPQARLEFPHEKLDASSKDMMWKLVIKFGCQKSTGKFKINFPGGEENYFNFLHQAVERHHKYLEKNKISPNSLSNTSSNNKYKKKPSLKPKKTIKKIPIADSKEKILFIVNGVFLGDESCNPQLGHYNMLCIRYDAKKKNFLIERIEPYGSTVSTKKIEKEFDGQLKKIFQQKGFEVKVRPPSDFFSPESFQWIEENEELREGIGEIKPGDAGGFCGAWSTFLAHQRFKYPHYDLKKIIKMLESKIIGEEELRTYIRNLSNYYLKKGESILGNRKLDNYQEKSLIRLAENYLAPSILA